MSINQKVETIYLTSFSIKTIQSAYFLIENIFSFTKFTSFTAADIDDNIRVGVFGQGLWNYSLSATESTRNGSGSTLDASERRYGLKIKQYMKRNIDNCNTYGKRESKTRCPVNRGWFAGSFSVTGRGWRTGHTWSIVYLFLSPSNSVSSTMS